MVDNIKYYCTVYKKLIGNDIKSQLSYRWDFVAQIIIWSLYTFLPFVAMNILFLGVDSIGEWDIYSVAIMYGIVGIGYDGARMLGRGFDSFEKLLDKGELDIFFIRPLSIGFQVYSSKFFVRRIAGIVQYIVVMVYGLWNVSADNTLVVVLVCICCIVNIFFLFLGLLVLYSSICFVTIKKNFFSEVVIDNVASIAYYPIEYLNKPMQLIFMYVIPITVCVYLPMKNVLFLHNVAWLQMVTGLVVSVVFFLVCNVVFNKSVRKYRSVNG